MKLSKLENLEPYKEYFGPISSGISDETRKEINKRKKMLENEIFINQFPKIEDFEAVVRQTVKEVKSIYQYDTYSKIQSKLLGESLYLENDTVLGNKARFDFYARFLGAVDKKLDNIQNCLEFCASNISKKEDEKEKQELLNFREKVIKDCKEEKMTSWVDNEIAEALITYPTHSMFGNLYKNLKDGNEVEDDVINLCLAYNQGYIIGDNLSIKEIERGYNKGQEELKEEKEKLKEYYRAVTRTRK